MKISTILDHIDSGHMALPEFQRGYVWNRDQVRGLFDSLYRRHPVGGLLVWATESKTATHRGDGALAAGVVKLLLDGQQRMTSLYGVVRGRAPKFFDGNAQAFAGLRFHLETETFEFYQPVKMKGDPLWTDVTELMQKGPAGLGEFVTRLTEQPALAPKVGDYVGRLSRLLGIVDVDLHVEEVTGADKSLDVVVNIFNRVNSGGTKLSKGDLALAKICAEWPEGRDAMKVRLKEWNNAGYHFTLDWLLRSVNTVLTGEAKFQHLHEKSATEVQDARSSAQTFHPSIAPFPCSFLPMPCYSKCPSAIRSTKPNTCITHPCTGERSSMDTAAGGPSRTGATSATSATFCGDPNRAGERWSTREPLMSSSTRTRSRGTGEAMYPPG